MYAHTQLESMAMPSWKIRAASKEDVPSILRLIQLLAEFNSDPGSVRIGEKELLRDGFGERPYFHVLLAELNEVISATVDPKPSNVQHNDMIVGYALYFYTYCRSGKCLFLEDIFVIQEYRGHGIGTALMQECAKVASLEECVRMQWEVADWNTRAAEMYQKIGGKIHKEWLPVRMTQPELGIFASRERDKNEK